MKEEKLGQAVQRLLLSGLTLRLPRSSPGSPGAGGGASPAQRPRCSRCAPGRAPDCCPQPSKGKEAVNTTSLNTKQTSKTPSGAKRRVNPEHLPTAGWAPPLVPAAGPGGTAPPPPGSPWLTSRRAWVKDGSRESFSAISSGRYFSSMVTAPSGSGDGAPGAPAGNGEAAARVRVPDGGKSSEAALPSGRLPPGAAGTHPEGSAANPRPGAGREGERAPGGDAPAQRTRDAEKSLCGGARGGKRGKEPLPAAGRALPTPARNTNGSSRGGRRALNTRAPHGACAD